MVMYANCHMHSTFSDGIYTPEKLVAIGKALGHKGMILTDHDTVSGTYFMQRAARRAGIRSILGCEFSAIGPENCEIHVLGFDFNPNNKKMAALLKDMSSQSHNTARYLLEKGMERGTVKKGIVWQDILEEYPYNDYISNNQIFKLMVKRGIYKPEEYREFFVSSFKQTAERKAEMAAAFSFKFQAVDDVIKTIIEAEGVPVIAHLGEAPYGKIDYTEELYSLGAMGFEICHPGNNDEARDYLSKFCDEHGLYKTGGTDHSADLGGLRSGFPKHNIPNDCGGMNEEDFTKLYERALG